MNLNLSLDHIKYIENLGFSKLVTVYDEEVPSNVAIGKNIYVKKEGTTYNNEFAIYVYQLNQNKEYIYVVVRYMGTLTETKLLSKHFIVCNDMINDAIHKVKDNAIIYKRKIDEAIKNGEPLPQS